MVKIRINFILNGQSANINCEPSKTLLDMIRDDMGLKGTKRGCEIGECGACTVLFNGKAVNSCMMLASQVQGGEVRTIEGIEINGQLHPLQRAFIEKGAVQCGFCTPGMILSAIALLDKDPNPSRDTIRKAIAGNICRCTGYKQIVDAIQHASKLIKNIHP